MPSVERSGYSFIIPFLIGLSAFSASGAESMTSRLKVLLSDQLPDRVATFLENPKLPSELRTHFRALKRATALQPATRALPRIVVYEDDARFFMSFNGGMKGSEDHGDRNESLEIMEWNDDDAQYDFFHIEFFPGGRPRYQIDGPNPAICISCHLDRQRRMIHMNAEKAFDAEDRAWFISNVIERGDGPADALRRYRSLNWAKELPFPTESVINLDPTHAPPESPHARTSVP